MRKPSKLDLPALRIEREKLPSLIAGAALSGDVSELANLKRRQAEVENEILCAECAARQSEIEALEAQRAPAVERAKQTAARVAAELPTLQQELAAVKDRALKIPGEMAALHGAVDRAQREVATINAKIERARQDLASYIEKTSKPPVASAA